MRLTKELFVRYVYEYQDMLAEEDEILKVLGCDVDWAPGRWLSSFYGWLSEMCELKDSPNGTTLDWFCFDTNFGKDEPFILIEEPDGATTEIVMDSAGALYDYLVTYEIPSYEKEN